jgi:hypothetical protein
MADQINLDTDAINRFTKLFEGLKTAVKGVDDQVKDLSKTLDAAISKMENLAKANPGAKGSGRGKGSHWQKMASDPDVKDVAMGHRNDKGGSRTSRPSTPQSGKSSDVFWDKLKSPDHLKQSGKTVMVGQALGKVTSQVGQAAAGRIDRGAEYALSSDRLNVQMMARSGMNHQEAQATRRPLRDFRLGGLEGNNTVLQQSMRLNTNTEQMGSFYAHQRAMTGYGRSTADAAQSYEELLGPEVANKMQRNLGVSPYKIGGGLKDPAQVQKELYQRFNLGNDKLLQGGKQLGSVTRSAMAQGGLGQKQQDELFLFAESQNTFASKGGKGTFDASKKEHREIVDIEDTFAAQHEQTELEKSNREERFADRHMDHFEVMEENQQKMVKILGNIESAITPALGFGIKNKPFSGAAGGIMSGLGLGLSLLPGGGAAMKIAGVAATALGAMSGDGEFDKGGSGGSSGAASGPTGATSSSAGSSNDATIKVPTYGGSASIAEVKNKSGFKAMHPNMQNRLLSMMREGKGKVGFGEGIRDSKVQERMFLDRYRPDPSGDVTYQGKKWKRVKGAAAAPPGRSMHEIGLAADLISTDGHKWMNANAHRFGLKHFANVNNEPWHVQPNELPNSRRKYEDQGAPWGTEKFEESEYGDTQGSEGLSIAEQTDGHTEDDGAAAGMATAGLRGYDGMAIDEIANAMEAENLERLGSSGSGGASHGSGEGPGGESVSGNYLGVEGTVVGADAAAQAAYAAGFRGSDLASIVAIAGRESGWSSDAENPNTSDTGMWQINFSAHKSWLKNIGVTRRDQLKSLSKNAEAAAYLFKSDGWKPWRASASFDYLGGQPGWDPDGDHLWKTDDFMSAANSAASSVDSSGDAVFDKSPTTHPTGSSQPSGPRSVSLNQPINVTVSPTINVTASNNMDLDGIADTIASMLEAKVRELNLRSS